METRDNLTDLREAYAVEPETALPELIAALRAQLLHRSGPGADPLRAALVEEVRALYRIHPHDGRVRDALGAGLSAEAGAPGDLGAAVRGELRAMRDAHPDDPRLVAHLAAALFNAFQSAIWVEGVDGEVVGVSDDEFGGAADLLKELCDLTVAEPESAPVREVYANALESALGSRLEAYAAQAHQADLQAMLRSSEPAGAEPSSSRVSPSLEAYVDTLRELTRRHPSHEELQWTLEMALEKMVFGLAESRATERLASFLNALRQRARQDPTDTQANRELAVALAATQNDELRRLDLGVHGNQASLLDELRQLHTATQAPEVARALAEALSEAATPSTVPELRNLAAMHPDQPEIRRALEYTSDEDDED